MPITQVHDIVICTLNREESLNRLLKSIESCGDTEFYKIVIIDSSLDQNYRDMLQGYLKSNFHPESLVAFNSGGLPTCRNYAFQFLTSELVHFFDDDVTLDENYFKVVEEFFANHPKVSGGGPRISGLYIDSKTSGLKSFLGIDELAAQGKLTKSGRNFWIKDDPSSVSAEIDWIPGCCMVFRKAILEEFKFNSSLERGPGQNYALGEDVDFTFRVSRSHKLMSIPHTSITHHLAPSKRDNRLLMIEANAVWWAYLTKMTSGHVKISRVILAQLAILIRNLISPFAVAVRRLFSISTYTRYLKEFKVFVLFFYKELSNPKIK